MRLRSGLGHKQAAESLSFKSGDHILGPTLFRGAGGAEKARGEVSSDISCIVKQTKKQQNEVFFQVVLARIVVTKLQSYGPFNKLGP